MDYKYRSANLVYLVFPSISHSLYIVSSLLPDYRLLISTHSIYLDTTRTLGKTSYLVHSYYQVPKRCKVRSSVEVSDLTIVPKIWAMVIYLHSPRPSTRDPSRLGAKLAHITTSTTTSERGAVGSRIKPESALLSDIWKEGRYQSHPAQVCTAF